MVTSSIDSQVADARHVAELTAASPGSAGRQEVVRHRIPAEPGRTWRGRPSGQRSRSTTIGAICRTSLGLSPHGSTRQQIPEQRSQRLPRVPSRSDTVGVFAVRTRTVHPNPDRTGRADEPYQLDLAHAIS